MANRSMAAKAERAQRQAREAAAREFGKPLWSRHETIGAANARREELRALIARYTGVVTVYPSGRAIEPVGKSRRQATTATYGDGTRRWLGALVTCR